MVIRRQTDLKRTEGKEERYTHRDWQTWLSEQTCNNVTSALSSVDIALCQNVPFITRMLFCITHTLPCVDFHFTQLQGDIGASTHNEQEPSSGIPYTAFDEDSFACRRYLWVVDIQRVVGATEVAGARSVGATSVRPIVKLARL